MNIVLNVIIGINSIIFLTLSIIHLYWAFGGKWGFSTAIPTTKDGKFAFIPGTIITLVVAFGLFIFAISTASNYGFFYHWIDNLYFTVVMWAIVIIFYLRAIGDFKLIGYSKKIKNTKFSNYDTKIISPLCLYLATSSLIILIQSNNAL